MFGTTHQELPVGKNYIKPGVHPVTIVDLQKENDYFMLSLKIKGEDDETSKKFLFSFKSEAAMNLNMGKFYEIVNAAGGDKAKNVEASDITDYLEKIKPIIVGKNYAQLFEGRKKVYDGKEITVAEIPLSRKRKNDPENLMARPIDEINKLEYDGTIKPLNDYEKSKLQGGESSQQDIPSWE